MGAVELIDREFEAPGKRHEHSATKGRSQTPAEMVLRLLLKHVRNWSFDVLERKGPDANPRAHRAGARWFKKAQAWRTHQPAPLRITRFATESS